jgi:hypothetical protein
LEIGNWKVEVGKCAVESAKWNGEVEMGVGKVSENRRWEKEVNRGKWQ